MKKERRKVREENEKKYVAKKVEKVVSSVSNRAEYIYGQNEHFPFISIYSHMHTSEREYKRYRNRAPQPPRSTCRGVYMSNGRKWGEPVCSFFTSYLSTSHTTFLLFTSLIRSTFSPTHSHTDSHFHSHSRVSLRYINYSHFWCDVTPKTYRLFYLFLDFQNLNKW